jgi:lipopolysaccharide transport system ATP-binding protein
MSDVVIQVDKLSKQYRLGTIGGKRLVDDANRWWAHLRGKEDPLSKVGSARPQVSGFKSHPSNDTIYALRDVSFEVKQGEVLGIIGRNGAGKSTLLKILSRVTAPTSGEVRVKGRIASLLEVGTGFHPELTGCENIFLNGAILGMTKAEIRSKLDEIVAFSEVEQFIDTPVKRYSSGMTVRLAFAVAAHLEPEILIVDEVLAVGDAAFQQKCIGKMQDVATHGRTVLFVSHNMGAIQSLCTRALVLRKGSLFMQGPPPDAVTAYLGEHAVRKWVATRTQECGPVRIDCVSVSQDDLLDTEIYLPDKPVEVAVDYEIVSALENLLLGIDVFSSDGTHLFRNYDLSAAGMGARQPGRYTSILRLPAGFFQNQSYLVELIAGVHRTNGWISRNSISLRISFEGPHTTDVAYPGVLQAQGNWQVIARDTAGAESNESGVVR